MQYLHLVLLEMAVADPVGLDFLLHLITQNVVGYLSTCRSSLYIPVKIVLVRVEIEKFDVSGLFEIILAIHKEPMRKAYNFQKGKVFCFLHSGVEKLT